MQQEVKTTTTTKNTNKREKTRNQKGSNETNKDNKIIKVTCALSPPFCRIKIITVCGGSGSGFLIGVLFSCVFNLFFYIIHKKVSKSHPKSKNRPQSNLNVPLALSTLQEHSIQHTNNGSYDRSRNVGSTRVGERL